MNPQLRHGPLVRGAWEVTNFFLKVYSNNCVNFQNIKIIITTKLNLNLDNANFIK